jgi:hypothetical protein
VLESSAEAGPGFNCARGIANTLDEAKVEAGDLAPILSSVSPCT